MDRYKTQVLLLHSEQSTLDQLRSGFTDDFTVHCATSGSEALNTLVDTPINVLISAHDLPGMSGLDALREAKKRSPETIGILLAGSKTADFEALVGDEEVFQVVSGNVTSDGLLTLVQNATRQVRMNTLADSANDPSAGLDEPEHIIMETAENGSTIITDGTGKLPTLDPRKAAAAAAAGARAVDVLVLTKDQEFLATIRDSSRGNHKVHYANTLGKANEAIRKHKIGVAIVDAAMVGEKIEQLNEHLRKGEPRLVSIVAGRREDGDMLMDLINRGKVYRFLLKPVSPGRARLAVESSVKHHLEAPDAAFKAKTGVGTSADLPPPRRPATKPAPKSKPTQGQKERRVAPPKIEPSIANLNQSADASPMDDSLGDAFGAGDNSFTETMTGIISSVGKKLTGSNTSETTKAPTPAAAKFSAESSSGKSKSIVGKLIAAAVVVAVLGGGAFFAFSGGSDEPARTADESNTSSDAESAAGQADSAASNVDVDALAADARGARDRGNIFSPSGYNAVELFAAAVAADPGNSILVSEMDAVVAQALTMAELAMLESRYDATAEALSRVSGVDPDNARLPFLTAQLAQEQFRAELDTARSAIREGRFEDAGFAISFARDLNVNDKSDLDEVIAELATARSEQQVDEVLARAHARLESGALLTPSNDNARYFYQLVLTNDPDNAAARQGLGVIAGKLAFQARTEIDNDELTLAADTLENARALDPNSAEVIASAAALENRIREIADSERQAETDRQLQIEREAEAERQAELQRLADEREKEAAALAAAEAAAAAAVANNVSAGESSTALTDNTLAGGISAAGMTSSMPTRSVSIRDQEPISVSKLNRTKYSAPKYPRSAQRRNLTGWVDLVFTVKTDGTVGEVEIRDSEPGDTFDSAAIKAVEKWEFEPVLENGSLIEKRAGVRLMFALE